MSLDKNAARAQIRGAGLRATAPRVAVLRLLACSSRALSHTEVVELLDNDDWDQATIYRNLVKLTEAGLAQVSSRAAGQKRYELASGTRHLHPHFVCDDCGTVSCLPTVTISPSSDPQWQTAVETAQLHFIGRCPPCSTTQQ